MQCQDGIEAHGRLKEQQRTARCRRRAKRSLNGNDGNGNGLRKRESTRSVKVAKSGAKEGVDEGCQDEMPVD